MRASRIARAGAIGAIVVGLMAGTASAAGDGPSRYARRAGDGPARIVVRCAGMAEDSGRRLILVDIEGDGIAGAEGDRYVYRCLTGKEV